LLWRFWRAFGNGGTGSFLMVTLVLALFTGLGWYAGQLMADIFTPIGLLAGMLFLLASAHWVERTCWALLMVLACWVHLSNLLILPLVLGLTAFIAWRMHRPIARKHVLVCFAVLIAAWPGLMLANRAADGEAYISRYSHVFLMGRLVETGMLPKWLDEHCPGAHYGICAYREDLPTTSKEFLWSDASPMRLQGGASATRAEYDAIVRSTLHEPKYIALHIGGSLRSTVQLLGLWRVADELEGVFYREPYSAPHSAIQHLRPEWLPAYLDSRQNTGPGTLALRYVDPIYAVILAASLVGLVVGLRTKALRGRNGVLLAFTVASVVISAWVCATFSTVDSRFMARTAWLLPFCVAMLVWPRRNGSPAAQAFHT
jgi:hypothetical protein